MQMDNEKKQRLEETLRQFENDIVDKISKSLSGMETSTQQQFVEINQRLDSIEQLIRELGLSETAR